MKKKHEERVEKIEKEMDMRIRTEKRRDEDEYEKR